MKRTILTTLAATALLAIPACPGGSSASSEKLIPEQATAMLGVDVANLFKSKLYVDNKALVDSNSQFKDVVEAAKGCEFDPEKNMRSVLYGTDMKSGHAVVVTGEGLGDEKILTCIADKLKDKNGGKVPFTVSEESGKKVVKADNNEFTGYIVDGRTLVFASTPWTGAVKDLIDGKGKSAVDGPHKDLFARADRSKHIWAAGVAPEDLASLAKSNQNVDVKDISGSIDLSDGVAVQATATLASPEQAAEVKTKVDQALPGAKAILSLMQVPTTIVDNVKLEAKDAQLSVEAKITAADLKALQEKAGSMPGGLPFGGGGGDALPIEPSIPADPPPAEDAPAE